MTGRPMCWRWADHLRPGETYGQLCAAANPRVQPDEPLTVDRWFRQQPPIGCAFPDAVCDRVGHHMHTRDQVEQARGALLG